VPTLAERLSASGRDGGALAAAWPALAASSVLDLMLALPLVSTAASVARWRRACVDMLADGVVRRGAAGDALRLVADTDAASWLEPMGLPIPAQLALRRWLADRLGWRPT
jgi:hypothetical protein